MNQYYPQTRVTDAKAALLDVRLVFIFAVVTSIVLRAEVFTLIIAAIYFGYAAFSTPAQNKVALRLIAPFALMAVIGLVMSGGNPLYAVGKDAWYLAKICLSIGAGVMIGLRLQAVDGFDRIILGIAWLGVVLTIFVMPFLPGGIPVIGREEEIPKLPIVCLAALPLLLDRIRARGGHFLWRDLILLLGLILASYLSDSRILLVAIVLMTMCWTGAFASLPRALFGSLALLLISVALWQLLPEYQGGDLTAMTKMHRSIEEILFTDAYDPRAMIMNWRGFEAYNAQVMFDAGTAYEKIFGFGMGSEIDLGQAVDMGEGMTYQFLPNLHNGFYYLVIKFGLVGMIVYIYAVLGWFQWRQVPQFTSNSVEIRILRGLVLIVLASTTVIAGLFNKDQMHGVTLLIAVILSAINTRQADWAAMTQLQPAAPQPQRARQTGAVHTLPATEAQPR